MRVAVLGAGAGGAAAAAELASAGHDVMLWNRSLATLEPFQAIGGVEYEGVLGKGTAFLTLISGDLHETIAKADTVLVCLPTFLHGTVARALAEAGLSSIVPVVLNPGHTGGALEFREVFRQIGCGAPPIAEFSTLTYVARKYRPQRVTITGRAKRIRVASLPGGDAALAVAQSLFASAAPVSDVLNSGLANVNMVLHPPGAILGAAWIEARNGDFTFYVDGMTPGVARVMRALDEERRAVGRAFGHELPSIIIEMQAIGTVEPSVRDVKDLAAAISGGEANRKIRAPDSLHHRYYLEDFGHGLLPFLAFARAAGIEVPVATSLMRLGCVLTETDYYARGRTADRMGIAGLDRSGLAALVRRR